MSDSERHFRAILTDPQIEALERAVARVLAANDPYYEDEAWSVNGPSEQDVENLNGALAAIQEAEVIV
jgi:hypothetical protein